VVSAAVSGVGQFGRPPIGPGCAAGPGAVSGNPGKPKKCRSSTDECAYRERPLPPYSHSVPHLRRRPSRRPAPGTGSRCFPYFSDNRGRGGVSRRGPAAFHDQGPRSRNDHLRCRSDRPLRATRPARRTARRCEAPAVGDLQKERGVNSARHPLRGPQRLKAHPRRPFSRLSSRRTWPFGRDQITLRTSARGSRPWWPTAPFAEMLRAAPKTRGKMPGG